MSFINCEINLILTWSKDFVITNSTSETKFAITETKSYVPVVTLSTKDNEKCVDISVLHLLILCLRVRA